MITTILNGNQQKATDKNKSISKNNKSQKQQIIKKQHISYNYRFHITTDFK